MVLIPFPKQTLKWTTLSLAKRLYILLLSKISHLTISDLNEEKKKQNKTLKRDDTDDK